MRRNVNNTTVNTTAQSSTSTAASVAASAKDKAATLKWADLTEEQQKQGLNLLYIMERREVGGVRQLECDKKSDPVRIFASPELADDKAMLRATGRVSVSARGLGGKYDKEAHSYSFPRAEFAKWTKYYKAAVAAGQTTIKAADTAADAKPAATSGSDKPAAKPATKPAASKNPELITKADALARCRKALAIALTKEMIDCMEDEIKAIFK